MALRRDCCPPNQAAGSVHMGIGRFGCLRACNHQEPQDSKMSPTTLHPFFQSNSRALPPQSTSQTCPIEISDSEEESGSIDSQEEIVQAPSHRTRRARVIQSSFPTARCQKPICSTQPLPGPEPSSSPSCAAPNGASIAPSPSDVHIAELHSQDRCVTPSGDAQRKSTSSPGSPPLASKVRTGMRWTGILSKADVRIASRIESATGYTLTEFEFNSSLTRYIDLEMTLAMSSFVPDALAKLGKKQTRGADCMCLALR